MAKIFPFKAVRPSAQYTKKVASPLFDVVSVEEARGLAKGNPYSFLWVDKAEINFPPHMGEHDPRIYEKARENLENMIKDGIMTQDTEPFLYIYKLSVGQKSQTGLGVLCAVSDYEQGVIVKHELIRPEKMTDRVNHINACHAQASPVFLAYREADESKGVRPSSLMNDWISDHSPEYDFDADDGVRHTIWVLSDKNAINSLVEAFDTVPYLYIADGHHRSAAAAEAAKKGVAGSDRFLSVIFPHNELSIMDYNRLVKDLNGLDTGSFFTALEERFDYQKLGKPFKPDKKGEYGLYIDKSWYRLSYRHTPPQDSVEGLSISILQNELLEKVLGISDPRTDKRIDFIGGSRSTGELEALVDAGQMAAAFTICPVTMDELLTVSDTGRVMPPKSTWFEPKLRGGLLVHKF